MLETPYKVPFLIKPCWTNGTVTLQCGLIQIRNNICRINPYKSGTKVEDINPEHICNDVNILSPVIYFCIVVKLGHKVYNQIRTETLTLIHISHARKFS